MRINTKTLARALTGLALAAMLVSVFSVVPASAASDPPISGYQIVSSGPMAFGDGGWGGWSCPSGKAVLGGGFEATGPVEVSAPGTPNSDWPHHTYGAEEYGWVIRDALDGAGNTITVYTICADEPAGYEVVPSDPLDYSDSGWGGWSCPAGEIVTGGGFELPGSSAAASAPATPGSVWSHYTFGSDEYGWVVQAAQDGDASPDSTVYAICADMPAEYDVVASSALDYGDGGWGGWSCPAGEIVIGGGFELSGGPAAASAPATPDSVWPHYTFGSDEYGWVVQDDQDGSSSPGSTVYAICAGLDSDVDGPVVGGVTTPTNPLPFLAPLAGVILLGLAGSAAFVWRRSTNQ